MDEKSDIREQNLAAGLLLASLGAGSSILDKLSSWLVAGYAAAMVVLMGKSNGSPFAIPAETMHTLMLLFAWIIIFGVFEKFLSAFAVGAGKGSELGSARSATTIKDGIQIDADKFIASASKMTIRPMRWLLDKALARARRGDLSTMPRAVGHCVQIQGVLTLLEGLAVICAVVTLARTAKY